MVDLLKELTFGLQSRNPPNIVNLAQVLDITVVRGKRSKFSMAAYLLNMAARLLAIRRGLKLTGSIYLHCDYTTIHYLKLIMYAIFGQLRGLSPRVRGNRPESLEKATRPISAGRGG